MIKQESYSEASSVGGKAKRRLKIAVIAAGVLALAYLGVVYYLDFKNGLIFKGACTAQDSYILSFKRFRQKKDKFWILNLRPGRILIETDQDIADLKLVTDDQEALPAVKVSNRLFTKEIRNNLIIGTIQLVPQDDSSEKINILISREPVLSFPFIAFQFAFLFILISLGTMTVLSLHGLIIDRSSLKALPLTTPVLIFLFLILTVFVFFVMNVDGVLSFSWLPDPGKAIKASLLFNLLFAILLLALFRMLASLPGRQKLPFFLFLLVGLPIVFYTIPFVAKSVGDSVLWSLNLARGKTDISFAEALSLVLNKLVLRTAKPLLHINARTTLVTTGKMMGLFSILSLFWLINSFVELSYKKKLLLFFLLLTFGFNVLFFGLPEFRYYPIPFLILSVLSAQRYIRGGDSAKPLILSAFLAVVAGLFHGSAFFSFPVILMLPLLKNGRNEAGRNLSSLAKPYGLILLTAGTTLVGVYLGVRALGFNFLFHTVAGGSDGRRFISFLPEHIHYPWAVNFTEIGYFISRGWIFLISGGFIFLIFLIRWKKGLSVSKPDFILFLFGLSQFLIVLFWGFDLGVRELDLYIAPTTLIYVFLAKTLVGSFPEDRNAWKYLLAFALFCPAYLLALTAT